MQYYEVRTLCAEAFLAGRESANYPDRDDMTFDAWFARNGPEHPDKKDEMPV